MECVASTVITKTGVGPKVYKFTCSPVGLKPVPGSCTWNRDPGLECGMGTGRLVYHVILHV